MHFGSKLLADGELLMDDSQRLSELSQKACDHQPGLADIHTRHTWNGGQETETPKEQVASN